VREAYRLLSLGLGIVAVAAVVGGLLLLHRSANAVFDAEVGKWLLTVATALVLTGALSLVVKEIDQRRGQRQAWQGLLHDLVAANQMVVMVRLRLNANRSALAYHEQLAELVCARLELKRISGIDIVIADERLRDHVNEMQTYVEGLGKECAAGYLPVARQQRLDELWLTERMKAVCGSSGAPELPDELACPTKAWKLLTDKSQFPRLAALLDPEAFEVDAFRINYKLAKRRLQIHAGFGDRSTKAWIYLARKLVRRTKVFLERPRDGLTDDVRQRVTEAVREVEEACGDKARRRIEEVTIGLCKTTVAAIRAVYPLPQRDGPVSEDGARVAVAREGHPATS
jgi:hypothetical protein